jgi:hypothetical protein
MPDWADCCRKCGEMGVPQKKRLEKERQTVRALEFNEEIENMAKDFAPKVALTMKEIASSNVYFILQQAFGVDSSDAVRILDKVIERYK